ncbi:hypothetical protein AVEN_161653-1 [Araneus ventricosus]|uniref:Uncharacterized protein n=1 Tax=Araneus ventricosus TaxID=182803 RepID=A0A4Y2IW40_ARAVE|nr:hypothetical protein AVEN_105222-1 [Araneus ventricosus]GBM82121.1 hypothetical protein AVEN_161653-1 [Araneus ventricosus]
MLFSRKFLRMNDDIHHWFTGRNNSSFVQNLGFIVQIQNSNGDGFPFQINECGRHKNTFLGDLARKVRYGVSELFRNFGNSLDKTF